MSNALNGVLFQGFHYYVPRDPGLWRFLASEADHLRAIGIDAVWIPPPQKGSSGTWSVGYDPCDGFDLGEFQQCGTVRSRYGTKDELHAAINALHGYEWRDGKLVRVDGKRYVQVYVDVVLNQMFGGEAEGTPWDAIRVDPNDRTVERWGPGYECGQVAVTAFTSFDHPGRGDRYSSFRWSARHFGSVDRVARIRQGGATFNDPEGRYIYRFLHNEAGYDPADKHFASWVSRELGNYDFLCGADLDYGRYDVREEMKYWGAWLARTIGADGVRLDAVKHYDAAFAREWIGHVRAQAGANLFCVGEYIAGGTAPLHAYLTEVTACGPYPQEMSLFDFPLRFRLKEASWAGERFDLGDLEGGTLVAEQPAKAVTFVENHDYQYNRGLDSHVREWFKPLAYAFILLRAGGYPCVFFPDYYGLSADVDGRGQAPGRAYLDLLLAVRKQFALGEERWYADRNVAGWIRMGGVAGAKGALAVVLNNAAAGVRAVEMDTGRVNRRFYHLATIKHTGRHEQDGFEVVRSRYEMYGDKAAALWTDGRGRAWFPADSGSVSLWLEDGVGLA